MTRHEKKKNKKKAMFFPLAVLDDLASPSFENKKAEKKSQKRKIANRIYFGNQKTKKPKTKKPKKKNRKQPLAPIFF